MFRFCLDGELLRAIANRLLERVGMPILREVVAVSCQGLAGTIVSPVRMGFSCMENDGQLRGGKRRKDNTIPGGSWMGLSNSAILFRSLVTSTFGSSRVTKSSTL
jgi:hypothetical protein